MSVDVTLRDDALASRRHELTAIARSHRALGSQLRAITAVLTNNTGLSDLLKQLKDTERLSASDANLDESVKGDDLLSGRYFDESTLPYPIIPQHDASIYASNPTTPSPQHPLPSEASVNADALATEATLTEPPNTVEPMAATVIPNPTSSFGDDDGDELRVPDMSDGVLVLPGKVIPPSAEDEANFTAATKDLLALESPQRPAKTVHLPPQDVQEERLRERRAAEVESRRRSDADAEKPSRPPQLHAQTELASSPSSTIGAYSTATPLPPQESPDTSPDSETAAEEVVPPKDLEPSPEEREAQEEHDRLLEAQKDIARREALGDVTPDDQLNWEAREAAARDEEERAAREAVNGPEASATRAMDETEAGELMEGVEKVPAPELPITPAPSHDEQSVSLPSNLSELPRPALPEEDGDNITVNPRPRLPTIDTSMHPPHLSTPPSQQEHAAPEATDNANITELREPPGPPSAASVVRQLSTPEPISPTTMRPQDSMPVLPQPILQRPQRAAHPLPPPTGNDREYSIADLAPLKGFAEDPERDYLEPLFRIQAHDSPNSQTRPLPDLVKSATKYMSTEDQYTTLHERTDYRILRRIYQLQNANKWSLRQMEKANEPEQPVTHMDHMMAEMKWMRKDFKAERKMKKSVCAWLASRCADWVNAGLSERQAMQVKIKQPKGKRRTVEHVDEELPDLDMSGESAPESDAMPTTPKLGAQIPLNLVVAPELTGVVSSLRKAGKLGTALQSLPIVGLKPPTEASRPTPLTEVSKFAEGKILPKAAGPVRKRSRFDYEDDAHILDAQPDKKRARPGRDLPPENQDVALFHPDNKHIRDRLHANNAFRPPSEFVMPGTTFYEFRNGSQWIWEDDQKLRKLAKEYTFNWSLIADEMTLPTRYKSSAERRTPWECFERWVELETLPAEMRKTMYFKTWFSRLEQSQQAAERRFQAQVTAIQAQTQTGQSTHVPQRRRTIPSRVEKRKNTRYLWLVDAMRKNAKKRENNAYKQAEAQRAAAQRKSQNDSNTPQRNAPRMTPQDFSKKRQERDLQIAEAQRQHRQKMLEAQQRQIMQARAAQQGAQPTQQRPGTAGAPQQHAQMQVNGQVHPNMNGQFPQQARPQLPMTTKNGHLAVPQVNAQGIPQAPMQAGQMSQQQQQMARIAHANAQRNAAQYGAPFQMPNGSMASPGSGMTTQQQLQHNQSLLAQMSAQTQQHNQAAAHSNSQQMSASPSMPPPPTPQQQQQQPGQLSSGHVPALIAIKNQLRAKHPHLSEDQLTAAATNELRMSSQAQSSSQVRQSAMNAAAGLQTQQQQQHPSNMQQAYAQAQNQQAFQGNAQLTNGNAAAYINGNNGTAQPQGVHGSPQAAAAYANVMRQQSAHMMRIAQQSPSTAHAQLAGSPGMTHVSPSMAPASPAMAYSAMQQNQGQGQGQMGSARPPSRNNTPGQIQRMGSSSSIPGVNGMAAGMQSPGSLPQSSPRNMQANMAR